SRLEKKDIGAINAGLERLRLKGRSLELEGTLTPAAQAELDAQRAEWDQRYQVLEQQLQQLHTEYNRDSATLRSADGRELELSLGKMVRAYRPNAMSTLDKLSFYGEKLWEFVSDEPREANTEG